MSTTSSTRPQLAAQRREVLGKAVAHLRRAGKLPAVVYGHGHDSEAIELDAKSFDNLRRHAGRNALLDLKVDGTGATPVIVHHVQEHPVTRGVLHVDFYVVKMTEELTVDVQVVVVGESHAAEKMGGTLLHLLDTVKVKALPAEIPQSLELDITPLVDFDTMLHVRDVKLPERVTLVTDPDEPIARVQPPRVEEEPVVEAAEEEAEGEAAEGEAEGAEGEAAQADASAGEDDAES